MAENHIRNAMTQLSGLESFASVEGNLTQPPLSLPQDRLRASGINPDIWCGLGIVGVWAALDAFAERTLGGKGSLVDRCGSRVSQPQKQILLELEDLRNLFAHNFAGIADLRYLSDGRRRCLRLNQSYRLACGYRFNGTEDERIALTLTDLKFYIAQGRDILTSLS